ncbi:hypothetical protein LTR64_003330 [Lithohypha guttulata]|uniref:uncharacterized protein n=1 Tax=Lithohypha guttulata TaxID=1690604 RepID=UPI002DE1DEF1|nr:hypothetical protein LTR51_000451 [Lithohypha guttulata]
METSVSSPEHSHPTPTAPSIRLSIQSELREKDLQTELLVHEENDSDVEILNSPTLLVFDQGQESQPSQNEQRPANDQESPLSKTDHASEAPQRSGSCESVSAANNNNNFGASFLHSKRPASSTPVVYSPIEGDHVSRFFQQYRRQDSQSAPRELVEGQTDSTTTTERPAHLTTHTIYAPMRLENPSNLATSPGDAKLKKVISTLQSRTTTYTTLLSQNDTQDTDLARLEHEVLRDMSVDLQAASRMIESRIGHGSSIDEDLILRAIEAYENKETMKSLARKRLMAELLKLRVDNKLAEL